MKRCKIGLFKPQQLYSFFIFYITFYTFSTFHSLNNHLALPNWFSMYLIFALSSMYNLPLNKSNLFSFKQKLTISLSLTSISTFFSFDCKMHLLKVFFEFSVLNQIHKLLQKIHIAHAHLCLMCHQFCFLFP